jgi:hypothetical protein
MKKLVLQAVIGVLLALPAMAQIPDSIHVRMNNLTIPTAPGFALLDESPTVIEHPANAKAFAASIFSAAQNAWGFPTNYAVELSPFWFFRHPGMTSYRYLGYNKKEGKQLPFSQAKMASISLAYVNTPDDSVGPGISNIAFGLRTNLLSVRSKRNIEELQKANDQVVNNLHSLNLKIISLDPLSQDYREKVQELVNNFEKDEELLKSEEYLRQQANVRPVFALDAAFAYSTFFLDNNFSDQHFGRLGLWAVLNYSQTLDKRPLPRNYVNIYAIARFIQDGTAADSLGVYNKVTMFDLGGKAEFELDKLSLGVEYILRSGDVDQTFRAAGMVKYTVSESIALTATFGRNFGEEDNLITLFGLSFGIDSGNEEALVK